MSDNIEELAAVFGNHQITDDEGNMMVESDTTGETSATPNETTVDKPAQENPVEPQKEATQATSEVPKVELAADETGKRYVPEARFDEIYGKMKEYERQLKSAPVTAPKQTKSEPLPQKTDKTDSLEVELLRMTLPQFDSKSPEYSEVLDKMGAEIYATNPGITRLEAGRMAIARARELAKVKVAVKAEAQAVKSQQSDQGITNRVVSREAQELDPDKMTLEEKEAWLRANDPWFRQ